MGMLPATTAAIVSHALYVTAAAAVVGFSRVELKDMGVSKRCAGFILMSEAVTLGMFVYGIATIDQVEESTISLAAAWVLIGWLRAASLDKTRWVQLLTFISGGLFASIAVLVFIRELEDVVAKVFVLFHVAHRVGVDGWWVLWKYDQTQTPKSKPNETPGTDLLSF